MNQEFYQKLTNLGVTVLIDEPMKTHTTFRIGGPADYFVSPDREHLAKVLLEAQEAEIPVTVIGNGSNLLISDAGIRGIVVEIGKGMNRIELDGETIKAEAGVLLSRAAALAAANSLTGMEFAAGIPGSIGGAVVMNAGAYGGEMKDIIKSVDVISRDGKITTLLRDELDLSYRHSCILEKEYIVLSAELELHIGDKEKICAWMAELKNRRLEKQPLEYPSAGSTFKRPQGYFAGKLIQDAGLRGYQVGDAQISEKHCGFVVNRGSATAAEVMQLICDVQKKVKEQFGVELEPEVKLLGEAQ